MCVRACVRACAHARVCICECVCARACVRSCYMHVCVSAQDLCELGALSIQYYYYLCKAMAAARAALHSFLQCERHFRVCPRDSVATSGHELLLMCVEALIRAITLHKGCTNTARNSVVKAESGREKKHRFFTRGIKPG